MMDPYRVLDIPITADDEAVRTAYLAAIRKCPPERDRQRFEQVRTAYEALSNKRSRLNYELFDKSLPTYEDILAVLEPCFQPKRVSERHLRRILGGK